MPEFVDIACHFDNEPVVDAYTGAVLWNAQFNTFDESSPDGSIVKRRTMSVRPGLAMPPRKTINIMGGEVWIVGDGNSDSFFGERIRQAYWLKKATDQAYLRTPSEAIAQMGGTLAYVHREYLKDTVNSNTDSSYDTQWDVSLFPGEPLLKGAFICIGDDLLRVRTTHADLSGLRVATCDELDAGAAVTIEFLGEPVYDPVEDTTTGTIERQPAIMLDMYKLYSFATNADPKNHSGDMTLLVDDRLSLSVGNQLSIEDVKWSVIAKRRDGDAWALHIRRQ